MTKNEIVEKLKRSGYHVTNESGVITFKIISDEKWPLDELQKKLASLEYDGSFGFTCVSGKNFQPNVLPEEDSTKFDFENSNTEFIQTSLFDM